MLSPIGRRAGLAVLLAAGWIAASGCASHPARRSFGPAGADQAERALEAWRTAMARADTLPPSRLLYDAKVRQGLGSISGALALSTAPPVRGALSGPFGAPIAVYADGVLTGEKLVPIRIEPEPLLSLLSGVWREPGARVRGIAGDEALLEWPPPSRAEGVIRIGDARFLSIHVEGQGRTFDAEYSGPVTPWPERVALTDVATKSTLRLVLQAKEPLP